MSTEMEKRFDAVLRPVIGELALHTPRDIGVLLQRATGRASRAGRKSLKLEDLGAQAEAPSMH